MTASINEYGQPVGVALPDWTPRVHPPRLPLQGHYCRLEPFEVSRHASELYAAFSLVEDGRDWTWLGVGPFNSETAFTQYAGQMADSCDPLHFAVIDNSTHRAIGSLALMRIEAQHGVMEVGYVTFSPLLKQTVMATEAHYLLMTLAFETLGYRRYEWKCDSLNAPSRRAAQRLGFQFEGVFRQLIVYKGRSRDTAWFSIIDAEWPVVKAALQTWLSPDNFTPQGHQIRALQAIREAL